MGINIVVIDELHDLLAPVLVGPRQKLAKAFWEIVAADVRRFICARCATYPQVTALNGAFP
jgi:hypothetical protein